MPESKNLIVFMAEGMPANAIGAFGHPQVKTPNLDRLAGQSAVFHRAYCTQPVCTPGRASLFTGRYPHETCPDNEHNLPGDMPCFPELSDFTDYRTAMIGKWDLGDEVFAQHGFETWRSIDESRTAHYSAGRDRSQGTSYAEFLKENGFVPDKPPLERGNNPRGWFNRHRNIPENLSPDAYAAQEAGKFIRGCGDQPFMLWMPFLRCKPGAFDAEDKIYDPAEIVLAPNAEHDLEHDASRHPKSRLIALQHNRSTREDWKKSKASYFAKITLIDRYVGEVLDELEQQGKADNTVVVFTSDHGMMLGEHGLAGKALMLEESIKVPMMIKLPGITDGGQRVETPFSHIDLAPTLLAALDRNIPATLPGENWLPFIAGLQKAPPRTDVMIEWNGASPKGTFHRLWARITEEIGPHWKGPGLAEIARVWTDPVRTIISADGWKFNYSPLGFHELFNLHNDPNEFENLYGNDETKAIAAELKRRIRHWQEEVNDTCEDVFDWRNTSELYSTTRIRK
ncbi:MAG: sulfatase [Verrucomicrobiota bacterium]